MAVRHGHAISIAVGASLACHGAVAVVLWGLPEAVPSAAASVAIELRQGDGAGGDVPGDTHRAPKPRPGGARSAQNVDAPLPGGAGHRTGETDVIFLVERAEPVTLQDSPRTAAGTAQAQRIRTAPDRATAEPRRATPNPSETPYLASGRGHHPERRPPSRRDARAGARDAPEATPRGS
ncbi:MAG: hypothetical protein ACOC97_05060, partial [Myxococcota bacterium]